MIIIVMGVAGSGKTTVGSLLAEELNLPFFDADEFHPAENVEKMKKGKPLSDKDRLPWLDKLADNLVEWSRGKGAVLACSALKEIYRRRMLKNQVKATWIFMSGDHDLLLQRLRLRANHFMSPELLESQLKTLEIPRYALKVSIDQPPQLAARQIMSIIKRNKTRRVVPPIKK